MTAPRPLLPAQAEAARGFAGAEPADLSRRGVWKGGAWQSANDASHGVRVQASGHAALDAELPGGGWPVGAMAEILLPATAHAEWSLVGAALAQVLGQQSHQRAVLVAPPWQVFTPFAEYSGIAARQLCCIHPAQKTGRVADADSVWVSEQALKCRDVCAVLAWLPHAQSQALRRLQLLAAQQRQLLWVFRPEQARGQASPAPLRLCLKVLDKTLQVRVIKRRGPPLERVIELPLLHAQLLAELAAQARRKGRDHEVATALLDRLKRPQQEVPRHALDGMAFAAR